MNAPQLGNQQIALPDQKVWPLLREQEIATMFGRSVAAIRRWRIEKRGPRYIKVGVAVRCRLEDVRAWLDARPSGGELTAEVRL